MQKTNESPLDRAAVAARAYDLFRARGGEPGHDLDDWLRAEAELRHANSVVSAVAELSLLPPPEGMEPIRLKRRRPAARKA